MNISQLGSAVTVTFDAPTTTLSPVKSYIVNFKGPSLDKELECAESPCVFDAAAIGELKAETKYQVLVKPIFAAEIAWASGVEETSIGTFESPLLVPLPLVPYETTYDATNYNCVNGVIDNDRFIELRDRRDHLRDKIVAGEWDEVLDLMDLPECPYDFDLDYWRF